MLNIVHIYDCRSDLEKDLDLSDSDDGSGIGLDTVPSEHHQTIDVIPPTMAPADVKQQSSLTEP